jgi:hypothetical protein
MSGSASRLVAGVQRRRLNLGSEHHLVFERMKIDKYDLDIPEG